MDISSIKANNRTIEIRNPATDELLGVRVTLLPPSDKKVKRIQRQNLDRQLQSKKSRLTAAQLEENNFDLVVAATDGWDWYGEEIVFEGEKPQFNEDNVRRVYTKLPWFKQQVRDAFDEEEAFFEA